MAGHFARFVLSKMYFAVASVGVQVHTELFAIYVGRSKGIRTDKGRSNGRLQNFEM